jgi:nicotinate phosphoribosyltransferase
VRVFYWGAFLLLSGFYREDSRVIKVWVRTRFEDFVSILSFSAWTTFAGTMYNNHLSLLTDLYQITMAQGYWDQGTHQRESVFHLFFRKSPFQGSYAIAAGIEPAIDWIRSLRITTSDREFLEDLRGNDGKALFKKEFLRFLMGCRFELDIDAVPEGSPMMAHEPIVRVRGPLLQCQWIESALLNIVNFQTLVATKAARVCLAAGDSSVLEFGLRRAQGIDGSLAASRACYIGGCQATSNVLAGKLYGIPVRGTHAHSWVMSFDTELEAFEAYARSMPNNCIFLVDTYNTLDGVRNAIRVAHQLAEKGHRLVGVRLDSGDMTKLSIEARKMFQEAQLHDAVIVASNDLDEIEIERMRKAGAQIDIWGVGTKLVTAYDQPALGGVYKLSSIQDQHGQWIDKIKLSEQWIKVSTPGILNVRRYRKSNVPLMDVLYSETMGEPAAAQGSDIATGQQSMALDSFDTYEDLLKPILRKGEYVTDLPKLKTIRENAIAWCNELPERIRSLSNPSRYPVAIEESLSKKKMEMMKCYR